MLKTEFMISPLTGLLFEKPFKSATKALVGPAIISNPTIMPVMNNAKRLLLVILSISNRLNNHI
jgi:hypothetical protein